MPLIKSGSKAAFSENVSEMMHAGHPQKQALAAAYATARKYGKHAEGGKVAPDAPSMKEFIERLNRQEQAAKYQEQTEQMWSRMHDRIYPPEALLWQKGIFPGTSADPIETDAADVARQRMGYQQGVNPWWSAKSFADGGDVEDVSGVGPTPTSMPDLSPLESIGKTAREAASYVTGPFQTMSRAVHMDPESRQRMSEAVLGKGVTSALQSPEAEAALGVVGGISTKPIMTFHTSPYEFEKFDLSKAGTGQGAATYGHGIYSSEEPKVSGEIGTDYWHEFAKKLYRHLQPDMPRYIAAEELGSAKGDRIAAAQRLEEISRKQDPNTAQDYKEAARLLRSEEHIGPHIYDLNIRENPERFIDYDQPAARQPKAVLEAAEKAGVPLEAKLHFGKWKQAYPGMETMDAETESGRSIFFTRNTKTGETLVMGHKNPGQEERFPSLEKALESAQTNYPRNLDARYFYKRPAQMERASIFDVDKRASQIWSEHGIPGIRYLTQGTRNARVVGKIEIPPQGLRTQPIVETYSPTTREEVLRWLKSKNLTEHSPGVSITEEPKSYNYVVFDPEKTPIDIVGKRATGGEAMGYADTARKYAPRQFGGASPWYVRQEAKGIAHEGLLSGPTPGRADKLPIHVPSGGYVIPADVVSGFGQGNTQAGALALGKMFGTGPLGMPTLKGGTARRPGAKVSIGHASRIGTTKMPKGAGLGAFADGGAPEDQPTSTTPIAASHGEYLVHPRWIIAKYGSLKKGHAILDEFVKHARKEQIKKLKDLPGPAK